MVPPQVPVRKVELGQELQIPAHHEQRRLDPVERHSGRAGSLGPASPASGALQDRVATADRARAEEVEPA